MILYFTHNRKPADMTRRFYEHNRAQAERVGQTWVAVVQEKIREDDILWVFDDGLPTYADLYQRILVGTKDHHPDTPVFLCEDDMLYPDERYGWEMPPFPFVNYNLNVVSLCERGFSDRPQGGIAMSQLFGRSSGVRHNIILKLQATLDGKMSCIEPGSGQPDGDYKTGTCRYPYASIDFRTEHNATWGIGPDDPVYDNLSGWGDFASLWAQFMGEET